MLGDKLKNMLMLNSKQGKSNNKKKIENLVFFIVVLIITIVIINLILGDDKKNNISDGNTSSKSKYLASNMEKTKSSAIETNSNNPVDLKTELEEILKKIQGVQDVNVFINYSETSETVAMYNENSKVSQTEETDTSGGIRKIEENDTQKEVVYQEDNGDKIPITQKVVNPKIEGAIITAKGANNANVKTNIIQAVEAATGLATHKIQVFEMN